MLGRCPVLGPTWPLPCPGGILGHCIPGPLHPFQITTYMQTCARAREREREREKVLGSSKKVGSSLGDFLAQPHWACVRKWFPPTPGPKHQHFEGRGGSWQHAQENEEIQKLAASRSAIGRAYKGKRARTRASTHARTHACKPRHATPRHPALSWANLGHCRPGGIPGHFIFGPPSVPESILRHCLVLGSTARTARPGKANPSVKSKKGQTLAENAFLQNAETPAGPIV